MFALCLTAHQGSLSETPDAIADHVLALYSAKLLAYTKHDPEKLVIDLEKITTDDGKDKGKDGAGCLSIPVKLE